MDIVDFFSFFTVIFALAIIILAGTDTLPVTIGDMDGLLR